MDYLLMLKLMIIDDLYLFSKISLTSIVLIKIRIKNKKIINNTMDETLKSLDVQSRENQKHRLKVQQNKEIILNYLTFLNGWAGSLDYFLRLNILLYD